MQRLAFTLTTVAAVLLVGAIAVAGDMTLTRDGSVYRVYQADGAMVLSHIAPDGSVNEVPVPFTDGIVSSNFQVGVDESTGTKVIVWQEDEGEFARVVLATYTDGLWYGPVVIAGGDGVSAIRVRSSSA